MRERLCLEHLFLVAARAAAQAASTSLTIRLILAVVLMSASAAATALEGISLTVGNIVEAHGRPPLQWKSQGMHIALTDLSQNPHKLTLTIDQLSLPEPFNDLNQISIRCTSFTWRNQTLICIKGRARMHSKRWQSQVFNFSFQISEKLSTLKLTGLQLAGGTMSIAAEERGEQWRIQINAKAVQAASMQKLLRQPALFQFKGGRISFRLKASGSHALIEDFRLTARLSDLTGQTGDRRFAAEKAALELRLQAQNHHGLWQWQSHSVFKGGALYIDPLYLEADRQFIIVDAEGSWSEKLDRVEIISANYKQANALVLNGRATVQYDKKLKLEKADLSLQSDNLDKLSDIYLKPLFEQTAWEGVTFAGTVNADFSIVQNSLTALTATFNKFAVKDTRERIKINNGSGTINWSDDEAFNQPSTLAWRQLQLYALPIGPARLVFLNRANSFKLLEKAKLPFLGGEIAIHQFGWQTKKQQEPELYFSGILNEVSLEQWSKALNWTPMSGTISGNIPRVEYRNKTLSLGGQINIRAFDGDIKITQLAASGLFSDFPKFFSNLEINGLDLEQLTGKFEFGSITGKLSGFVRQLTMENWRPVTFFAWLGTPDDDNSRHRISQKAVKNIASIGGGGASDILSRSFLSFFETFGYDKLGLGCYLHDGVCQLMGVEATPQGYAIITGGGLPRIEVIGYNPRIDWNVLMERLSRISESDEVIIK
jgi:hypothetical protein